MTLLGIDTSTSAACACVLRADGESFELAPPPERLQRPPAHASELMPAVAEVMDRAEIGWGDLDAIAVGVGPGMFTGLRIGIATARALARRAACRSGGVSLAALAAGIDAPLRLPLIDARRGEVFGALYDGDERVWPPFAIPPAELVRRLRDEGFTPLAAGDGSVRFREVLDEAGIRSSRTTPRPTWCVRCTSAAWGQGARPAAGGRSARLSERPGRKAATVTPELEIRQLAYADLPQVIAIERRAFPTPWSLAMFVLELSKPSGICLAALEEGVMVGYLVCSRYDTVWHLMNVAVDRAGAARESPRPCSTGCSSRRTSRASSTRSRCALQRRRIRLYERFGFRAAGRRRAYYHDNREDALIMWRTVEERTTA